MELIQPDPGTLLWTLASFLLVLGILWKFAWPRILETIDARATSIRDDLAAAKRAREEGERSLADYQRKLEAARAEAQKIIEEGKSDAMKLRDSILSDARAESGRMAERALREISLAEGKAREGLRQEAVNLAADMAGKVIGRAIRAEDHRDILGAYVADVESRAGRDGKGRDGKG